MLQYTVDSVGGERYTLHVRDIATGKAVLTKPIEGTAGDVEWWGGTQKDDCTFYPTLNTQHSVKSLRASEPDLNGIEPSNPSSERRR